MSEWLVTTLIILGSLIFIWLISYLILRRNYLIEKNIKEWVWRQGWEVSKICKSNQRGYTIKGDGWFFERMTILNMNSNSSANKTYQNRWFSDKIKTEKGLIIIDHKIPLMDKHGLGYCIALKSVERQLCEDEESVVSLREVEIGVDLFRDRFSVFVKGNDLPEKVVTNSIQMACVRWNIQLFPFIKIHPEGIEIRLDHGRAANFTEIFAMVELGNAFLN